MDIDRARSILGVAANTPLGEAKKRYLARAQMLHPDKATSEAVRVEAEAMMKELNEAWRTVQENSRRGIPTPDPVHTGGGESPEPPGGVDEPAHEQDQYFAPPRSKMAALGRDLAKLAMGIGGFALLLFIAGWFGILELLVNLFVGFLILGVGIVFVWEAVSFFARLGQRR